MAATKRMLVTGPTPGTDISRLQIGSFSEELDMRAGSVAALGFRCAASL